jgi:hypothetical protein
MTAFRHTVSFESDTQPVETVRGEMEARDLDDAVKRACFRANNSRAGKWKPRSLVCVVERMEESAPEKPNKTGPRFGSTQGGRSI